MDNMGLGFAAAALLLLYRMDGRMSALEAALREVGGMERTSELEGSPVETLAIKIVVLLAFVVFIGMTAVSVIDKLSG